MAKNIIFRENYLTHKPNGFTPDEYEKNDVNLDSYSFRKENNKKKNKEEQKESRNMAKNIIRLTESDLHRIVKESVQKILKESGYSNTDGKSYIGPRGDFDSAAYAYDSALDDAESIEDWDRMMKNRKDKIDTAAGNALNLHPGVERKGYGGKPRGSLGASKYVSPETFMVDDPLKDLEDSAEYGRKRYGFPVG